MSLSPLLLQSAGSLVAILALAGLAWWLKLGGTPVLDGAADVGRAASEVEDGFVPTDFAVSDDRAAAVAKDAHGRIMIIRRHGNRFAGRILGSAASAQRTGCELEVDCGEIRFGKTRIIIPDPDTWAAAINALTPAHHA